MGYVVDYEALDTLYSGVKGNVDVWADRLSALAERTSVLAESGNMSGRWADSVRSYLSSVHGSIISLLRQMTVLLGYNCLLYKRDYQANVDTSLHAYISLHELDSIKTMLEKQKKLAVQIDSEVDYALERVKDIFSIRHQDSEYVAMAHQQTINYLVKLDEQIKALEQRHVATDFAAVDDMISALRAFITEMQGQNRGFKTGFSTAALTAVDSFQQVYNAHLAMTNELEKKADAIETAIDGENQRLADLQAEEDERQKQANTVKWIVTGVCIVGSIVAIVATGGAATPLIVGAVSAASSAVIAGTNNLADQYVQNGDLNDADWGSFGKDVVIGGVTGFVTGYAGAAIGGAVTSGLSQTSIGASLLNSSNAAVRIGSGAVIGSVSEVSSGIVSRGAGTLISSGGDWEEAMDAAFDGKQIATDAAIGGATGGVGEYRKFKAEKGAQPIQSVEYDDVDWENTSNTKEELAQLQEMEYDDVDWENTSNTKEELAQLQEMEKNGDFVFEKTSRSGKVRKVDYGATKVDQNLSEPGDFKRRLPTENSGTIIGDRDSGTFEFVPDDEGARAIMKEYGQDTIKYTDKEAVFSPFTKHNTDWGEVDCQVEVGYMNSERVGNAEVPGNYTQADIELSKKMSAETGQSVTPEQIKEYRESNALTWHEVGDKKTMQLVPTKINEACPHSGGVSAKKYEMAWGNLSLSY